MDGDIILPLPRSFDPSSTAQEGDVREEVRMLESTVLTWVKQIRLSLAKNPEEAMKSSHDPWPSTALDFWSEHAKELKCILDQITNQSTRKVRKEAGSRGPHDAALSLFLCVSRL